jgi:septum formation inhibitor-activating ATPase MinD
VDENQLDADKVRMEMEKENMEKSMEEKFGWYLVLNRIANDDITRHDSITKKGIIEALNMLSYLIEKDKEEIKRFKKANNII